MKSVLLIGLGKFGQTLGEALLKMGDEVLIADKNEEIINTLASKYTSAVITNCMNTENLVSLDIPSFDACIVAIGEDFQSSLEITSRLKELGARHVISKAASSIQKKFLLRNGADEVIYPDEDIALKTAIKINSSKVFDYIEINDDYSVFEIAVPVSWNNQTIQEINPRKEFGLNILTIKKDKTTLIDPHAGYKFNDGDHIIVFGETTKILSFANK